MAAHPALTPNWFCINFGINVAKPEVIRPESVGGTGVNYEQNKMISRKTSSVKTLNIFVPVLLGLGVIHKQRVRNLQCRRSRHMTSTKEYSFSKTEGRNLAPRYYIVIF